MQRVPFQPNPVQRQKALLRFQQGILALANQNYACFDSASFVADLSGYMIALHRRGHLDVLRRLLASLADCCVCSHSNSRERAILVVAVCCQQTFPWRDRKVFPVLVDVFAKWLQHEDVWYAGIPFVCRQIQALLTDLDGQGLGHLAASLATTVICIQNGDLVKNPMIRQVVGGLRGKVISTGSLPGLPGALRVAGDIVSLGRNQSLG